MRSALLGIQGLLATLLLVGCSGYDSPIQDEDRPGGPSTLPNIVFVLVDDLDYASAQKMPALRSLLIEGGASFDNAFVSYPWCCPSRATILTGLYAHNHDVRGNKPPDGGFEKFREEGLEEKTIAVRLQETGYRTAFFGKYLNGYAKRSQTHVPPGWDEWYGKLREQKLYNYWINENGEIVSYGNNEEDFYTDVLSKQATEFVRNTASDPQPFFMYVAPTAPHAPATPAERHKGKFAGEKAPRSPSFDEEDVSDKPSWIRQEAAPFSEKDTSDIDERYQQRLESMLAVDEMVDSLVRELEAAGKLDNTYLIFTSDNGWYQGEHRIAEGKETAYEESVHVPLFVRAPGIEPGSKIESLVVNTDFSPTFADLAGADFSADGRSLKPLFEGQESSWRHVILLERPSEQADDGADEQTDGEADKQTGSEDSTEKSNATPYEAVRTESYKYVEYQNGERELYDLDNDPYELDNIYGSADPSLLDDLTTKLESLETCASEDCWDAEDNH